MASYPVNNRQQHPATTTWHLIQSTIDSNIQQQMDNDHKHLNRKLDQLLQKQPKRPTQHRYNEDCRFYTRVQNLTNIKFNKEEMQLLKYGLNYSIERLASTYAGKLIAETERAIRLLDIKVQNTDRIMATNKLKQIINSTSQSNVLQKRQLYVLKGLNKKLTAENAIDTPADKWKTIVIINSNDYSKKANSFLSVNNLNH
jgi:hypothetical protein